MTRHAVWSHLFGDIATQYFVCPSLEALSQAASGEQQSYLWKVWLFTLPRMEGARNIPQTVVLEGLRGIGVSRNKSNDLTMKAEQILIRRSVRG